jgi:hypothetical protein
MSPSPATLALAFTPFSPTMGAVAFWAFVAVCAASALWSPVVARMAALRTIRHIVEKGGALDPVVVERLLAATRPRQAPPENMLFGGLILLACGPGLAILGWFLGHLDPKASFPLFGVGALVTLLGVAMVCGGIWGMGMRRRARAEGQDGV